MSDEPIAWLRDLDGTGSLHARSKEDPGAIEVFAQPERYTDKDREIERLREALQGVVAAHYNYLESLSSEVREYVDDPLAEACETARAALIPDPAGGMPVEVK